MCAKFSWEQNGLCLVVMGVLVCVAGCALLLLRQAFILTWLVYSTLCPCCWRVTSAAASSNVYHTVHLRNSVVTQYILSTNTSGNTRAADQPPTSEQPKNISSNQVQFVPGSKAASQQAHPTPANLPARFSQVRARRMNTVFVPNITVVFTVNWVSQVWHHKVSVDHNDGRCSGGSGSSLAAGACCCKLLFLCQLAGESVSVWVLLLLLPPLFVTA